MKWVVNCAWVKGSNPSLCQRKKLIHDGPIGAHHLNNCSFSDDQSRMPEALLILYSKWLMLHSDIFTIGFLESLNDLYDWCVSAEPDLRLHVHDGSIGVATQWRMTAVFYYINFQIYWIVVVVCVYVQHSRLKNIAHIIAI